MKVFGRVLEHQDDTPQLGFCRGELFRTKSETTTATTHTIAVNFQRKISSLAASKQPVLSDILQYRPKKGDQRSWCELLVAGRDNC